MGGETQHGAEGAPDHARRALLERFGLLVVGLVSGLANARGESADSAQQSSARSSGDPGSIAETDTAGDPRILLAVPQTVEDGAVVSVTVESQIPGTRAILVLVEENPIPFAARFTIPPGTDPFVSTRIKMARSGVVRAAVEAGGRLYANFAETAVTRGGCS
jgi:sulfur-oxidizing protein SoxY